MVAKKESFTKSKEMRGRRIKVGKLQSIRDSLTDLTSGEQKRVKGGIVIRIIGVLIGGHSTPSDQRQP